MKKLKWIPFIITLLTLKYGFCQLNINEIHYRVQDPNHPYTCADTLNYYLIFEYLFDNDSVIVFSNDSIYYKGNLKLKSLYSKEIRLDNIKNNGEIFVRVNDSPLLNLQMIDDKKYIRFSLKRKYGILEICYSKYPPIYK